MTAGFGYIYSGGVLTVTLAGTAFTIDEDHKYRNHILDILGSRDLSDENMEDQIIELLRDKRKEGIEEALETISTDDIEIRLDHGVVTIKGQPVTNELTRRVLEMAEANIPLDGLLQFMCNLSENPSNASRAQLFKFLDNGGFPITPDGHFLGYRGVLSDFKDKYTGRFDNSPGSILEMPRENVCADPSLGCAPGFHVGTHRYATRWGATVVLVKVNPRDAVSVPNYETEKLRVCRFEVIRVYEGESVLARPQYSDEEIRDEALLANDDHYRELAATKGYDNPFDEEEEEEEIEVTEPGYDDLVSLYTKMTRDDVCREAARRGIFFSTNEARDMGKEFVVHSLASKGIPFQDCTLKQLIQLAVRRGLFSSPSAARKKGRTEIVTRLSDS